jgi:hypothetical protein
MSILLPRDCRAAVSLTFDDGTRTQRELAVPVLAEHGLRGTFYLNPGDTTPGAGDWRDRLAPWTAVGQAGHELGNHTLTHPCPRLLSARTPAHCLESLTLAQIEHEIAEAQGRLQELTGVAERSLAYPCCGDFVGEGPAQQSYVPVVARYHATARHGLHTHTYLETCNLHTLPAMVCWRHSGAEMVGWADVVRARQLRGHPDRGQQCGGRLPSGPAQADGRHRRLRERRPRLWYRARPALPRLPVRDRARGRPDRPAHLAPATVTLDAGAKRGFVARRRFGLSGSWTALRDAREGARDRYEAGDPCRLA